MRKLLLIVAHPYSLSPSILILKYIDITSRISINYYLTIISELKNKKYY